MKLVYELDVYRLAEKLSDMVWNDYDDWSAKAQRTIGLQAIRASDSIAANLAEGYGRYTPADRKTFYRYARGSFEETKAWLRKAIRRKVISPERALEYKTVVNTLGPKLNAFIKTTRLGRTGAGSF
ncbi:MAG: four helix bundle protein [Kiritimatiellae bacterium]|nr:four helix bundle protein [Kiritimatiellia bacterium]